MIMAKHIKLSCHESSLIAITFVIESSEQILIIHQLWVIHFKIFNHNWHQKLVVVHNKGGNR
jgi:hypothetical protein